MSMTELLIPVFLFVATELGTRLIDKYIFRNKEYNAIRWLAFLFVLFGLIVFYHAFSNKDTVVNSTSEDNAPMWSITVYDGTQDLNDRNKPRPPSIWAGTIRGNRNGLQYDMGFDAPQFFHSRYFFLKDIFNHNLPKDEFSAEFTTDEWFESLTYCFSIEYVDDGANLLIDDKPLVERWWGYQRGGLYREPKLMNAGNHKITLQYYDTNAGAGFQLQWYPTPGHECTSSGDSGYSQKYEIP